MARPVLYLICSILGVCLPLLIAGGMGGPRSAPERADAGPASPIDPGALADEDLAGESFVLRLRE